MLGRYVQTSAAITDKGHSDGIAVTNSIYCREGIS
ncbi:hypothetical protein SPHINGO391_470212 [Sphingomonas aurantiaca]|uniref:Uncharacterized protein n=1 Tax=Sphingomonas aurantiaca TaxID=185949 RepID=A0A5E7ZQU1_9SPHN|nr:hypothetical protein SPHINGO391_470212 [Sphingomonas aurantiaca]